MVLPDSDGISRVPPYSGYRLGKVGCRIRGFHPVSHNIPIISAILTRPYCRSYNPRVQALWFGLFPFRSPLLRESRLLSLPAGTEMFQFPTSTFFSAIDSLKRYHPMTGDGFPHSEISGSKLTYSSPKHIGVRPVLHRLLVPRHPPCALIHLTDWLSV